MSNLLWRTLPGFDPTHCELPPLGAAHLYSVPLQSPASDLERFLGLLSEDEKARASRFHFEVHRSRFAVGRGFLRLILSSYLQEAPAQIRFSYGAYGKPSLTEPGGPEIQFNLAHSDDLALIAITSGERVGVDIEHVRALEDFDDLVNRFFSPGEAAAFQQLPTEAKPSAFFNLWTRKEAMLKATGEGIGHCLNQVEVTFLSRQETKLLRLPRHFGQLKDWALYDLQAPPGFAAALAIQRRTNL